METILLTSAGIFDVKDKRVFDIFGEKPEKRKIAYVTTAAKPEKDALYVDEERKELRAAGFRVESLDIEGKNAKELKRLLKDKNIIYVQGGNTFYLLKRAKESGFDKVVRELLKKGVIYVGVSAGSYIACPTIEAAAWKNQDQNIVGLTDLTALNLTPFILFCHYRPEHKELLEAKKSFVSYPLRILTDEQAILIRGRRAEFLGGPEIKI